MKRPAITILLTLFYLMSYSDVGKAFRYKATFKLNDNSEITGYFYFPTYQEKFDSTKLSFNEYIDSNYSFPIRLFSEIKTRERNEFLIVDFAVEGSEIKIDREDISNITLIEEIEYTVCSRLIEISAKSYQLIDQDLVRFSRLYQEELWENCSYHLLNFDRKNNLDSITESILIDIKELKNETNYPVIEKYIDNKQLELEEKNIVFYKFCWPL